MNVHKKILIVERNPALRQTLYEKLAQQHFSVMPAADGRDGLKMALGKHPNLIVLNIPMPEKDGFNMLEQLRKDLWGKTAKVMIITDGNNLEEVSTALQERVYHFCPRFGWNVDDIISRIKEHIP